MPAIESSPEAVPFERGSQRRRRRRIRHNLVILVAAVAGGWPAGVLFDPKDLRSQLSAGSAYVSLACVALSLALGPLNVLRSRPNPVSNDLRRDLGIWGAVVGLFHVGVGLTVHLRGKMYQYFVPPPGAKGWLAFGGANYLGAIAGIVLLVLLALSNDKALGRLGAKRWKRWQQLNYVVAVTTLLHGVLYQLVEKQRAGFVLLFALVVAGAFVLQLLAIRELRRSKSG